MAGHITTVETVLRFAPRLTRVLEDSGILLLLDNLETLLTPTGHWRDPRWEGLIAALTGHQGESRTILTSRVPPADMADGMLMVPVHALALDEAAALARELPHLRGLLHADSAPARYADPAVVAADRNLVRRVLRVVQGHPKLMELADATAADPARLAAQLDAAQASADGRQLDAFFREGTSILDSTQFLDAQPPGPALPSPRCPRQPGLWHSSLPSARRRPADHRHRQQLAGPVAKAQSAR